MTSRNRFWKSFLVVRILLVLLNLLLMRKLEEIFQAIEKNSKQQACVPFSILYRGVNTDSMFYDQVPINDTFKKVDDNTLFGVMDNKAIPDIPYFFVLEKFSTSGN